ICWYHWEVIDAACCDGVSKIGNSKAEKTSVAQRTYYKPAPENSQLGDVLPISESEWVKLAAVLASDRTEGNSGAVVDAANAAEKSNELPQTDSTATQPTIAQRVQRMFKK